MSAPSGTDLLGILISILNSPSAYSLSLLLGEEEAFEALNIHHEWNRRAEIATCGKNCDTANAADIYFSS